MQLRTAEPTNEENPIIQLIVFSAGKEEFGIPIEQVREIIKVGLITPIPNAPDFIKGIVNVRGEIVTTIDIELRFKLPIGKEPSKHIVVTKQEDGLFGLIVDEVTEVLRIQRNEVKSPPTGLPSINKKYIKGIISHDERIIILLDLAKILAYKEFQQASAPVKRKIKNGNNQ